MTMEESQAETGLELRWAQEESADWVHWGLKPCARE